jgi:hypothetical protein
MGSSMSAYIPKGGLILDFFTFAQKSSGYRYLLHPMQKLEKFKKYFSKGQPPEIFMSILYHCIDM